jgi:hypothetical protein
MKRQSVFQMVPMTAAMITLLGLCAGCETRKETDDKSASLPPKTHAHNLKFVKCSSQNGEGKNVTIEVTATPQVLLQPDDRLIFVCPTELVTWHASSPNTTIEIHFKDKSKAAKLFKTHDTDLTSLAGSGGDAATAAEEVIDTASSDMTHGYTIIVKQGSNVFHLDPHIIPVGN